jgi:dCTP deaminase
MVLADRTIRRMIQTGIPGRGGLVIDPFDPEMIQPASIDVKLDNLFRVTRHSHHPHIDVRNIPEDLTEEVVIPPGDHFVLHPGELVLAQTIEMVGIPPTLVARLEGRSSLGRIGLMIHSTAGWIDPGYRGTVTLELSNEAILPIMLWPGMKIGQLAFFWLSEEAERPYSGKYQDSTRPGASKIHLDFER